MSSANIHQQEIHTFDTNAQDWWNPQGTFKTLHDINPLRLAFIAQHVDLQHKQVIDVGCGGGILAESMAACAAQVTGIDMSEPSLAIAKQHAGQQGLHINYQQTLAEDMAEKYPGKYDIVTCMELLEHVPDPASVIHACTQLVTAGGYVFFSTLNRNLKSYLFAVLGAEYIFKLLPRGIHHYDRFIQPAELAHWARSAGLEMSAISGIDYNPLLHQCRLSSCVDVNYLACFRRS